jgi:hypothetical protein
MQKYLILLVLSVITISCSDSSTNYNEIELNKEFNIKVGDSAVLVDRGVVIKFKSVAADSRCPAGAVCAWEGNATAILELKNSNVDTLTANLNTSIEPKVVNFSNLIIELKSLAPYPKLNESINPNNYIAKLLIRK